MVLNKLLPEKYIIIVNFNICIYHLCLCIILIRLVLTCKFLPYWLAFLTLGGPAILAVEEEKISLNLSQLCTCKATKTTLTRYAH